MTSEEMSLLGKALRGDADIGSVVWMSRAIQKVKIAANAHDDVSALSEGDNQRLLEAIVARMPAYLRIVHAAHQIDFLDCVRKVNEDGVPA